jgi:tRNA-5-methyluridine54 2-sulfurtransferase
MNRVARDSGYSVLATGHNLDDEAATLLGNSLNWKSGHLLRQSPVLEATHPGVVRKVKPLCRIYEREMAAYALLRGIEYIYEECPFSRGANSILYKEMLNQLETSRPGGKLIFYLNFLEARQNGLFTPLADPDLERLHACPSCGQPTTAPQDCAFCCLMQRRTS